LVRVRAELEVLGAPSVGKAVARVVKVRMKRGCIV
jgi:hypothetical protein